MLMSRIHTHRLPDLIALDLPPFGVALAIASLFYKFGNFLPEAIGFVGTWYVLHIVYVPFAERVRLGAAGRLRRPS